MVLIPKQMLEAIATLTALAYAQLSNVRPSRLPYRSYNTTGLLTVELQLASSQPLACQAGHVAVTAYGCSAGYRHEVVLKRKLP